MAMPDNLIFVRHGESEANVVNHAAKAGDDSLRSDEFKSRHDSDMRLTPKGETQAQITGAWLRDNIDTNFDRQYVSPHRRTRETAANLGVNAVNGCWMVEDLVRERDWGEYSNLTDDEREAHFPLTKQNKDLNPWYWMPPGGESLATGVRLRFERHLDTLHREMEKKNVLTVTHGEYMWVARFVLERMDVADWLKADGDDSQRIQNTMVLQYTRKDPENSKLRADKLMWARAICPWDTDKSINGGDWWQLERNTYSDRELMEQVEQLPRLLQEK